MDNGLNMKKIEEAVVAWIAEREAQLSSIPLSFRDISDSSVTVEANSKLLQIVIPPSFQMLDCDSAGPAISTDEVFLVTSLENNSDEIFDDTLAILNEKLERINIRSDALSQVLASLLQAIQKFEAQTDQVLKHNSIGSCSKRKWSNAQTTAEDMQIDVLDDEGSQGAESDTAGSVEEETPEDDGYDLASGECVEGSSERGFLYAAAQDAKRRCDFAREITSDWVFENSTALDGNSCDCILRWCGVTTDFQSLKIHLLMHVGGIVRDDSATCALGFNVNSPMKLSLQFSKQLWSQVKYNPMSCPLKPEKWFVTQERYICRRVAPDDIDEESLKLRKVDQAHLYGTEVLLPELLCTYFDFLLNKTVSIAKLENPGLLSELQQCSAMNNPFTGLLCFLSARLRTLPAWCFVCWNPLPFSVCRLRTCDREFCLFKFEDLGLGTPVLQEVQKFPELIDFELSLAIAAAQSDRDVFEPFPAFLLQQQEIRGRSGWFSKLSSSDDSIMSLTAASNSQGPAPKGHTAAVRMDCALENKKIKLLKSLLYSYPSIEVMKGCPDEVTLMKTLTKLWRERMQQGGQNQEGAHLEDGNNSSKWREKLWLPYDVLRFVLSTSRLSLYLLQNDEKLDFGAHYQFAVLHDSPEREAHFERRRIEQGGSFFAFHGSAGDNWFSILRNGLRCLSYTGYMRTGAAYGTGIYLASNMATSMKYSLFRTGWRHGSLKHGFAVIAICEVINRSIRQQNMQKSNIASLHAALTRGVFNQKPVPPKLVCPLDIIVVPPEYEKDVAIRYILVFSEKWGNSRENHVISGTSLCNGVDMMNHYQLLRSMYPVKQEKQQQVQKAERWQSMLDIVKEGQPNDTGTQGGSQAIPHHPHLVGHSNKTQPEIGHPQSSISNHSAHVNAIKPSASAMQAISKEYKLIIKQIHAVREGKLLKDEDTLPILAGIQINIPDERDLCRWHVSLSQGLFKRWPLYEDLTECARQWNLQEAPVELEFVFPATYPFAPPFVRVISPIFSFHTGHVTVGGSICMELLTESGWSPACSFESVLVQVVNAMIEGGGRLDRTAWSSRIEYSEYEAREAFDRVARAHGWIL